MSTGTAPIDMFWRSKMILYFSATGNCKYVALRLAEAAQKTLSIVDCIRDNRYAFAGETIGIVSPS